MAPTTRSQNARIAGFPQIESETHNFEYKRRSIPTENEPNSQGPSQNASLAALKDTPPVYTIDLSLPPAERYVQAAIDFKEQISGLTGLFEEILDMMRIPSKPVTWLSWLFLRRLYNKEQTEEIRGVSHATGVSIYLLVAFNTLLDLFMGCTSGGVKVFNDNAPGTRMLHFRTLDWGMDALRKVIVQLEFVERSGGPVIARSITYVGFVGILTGVRQDLSVSLNYRPYHDNDSSKMSNLKFYSNHLLILLGIRPSVSSTLRNFIVPGRLQTHSRLGKSRKADNSDTDTSALPSIEDIKQRLPSMPTTAAYLIFCSGEQTIVVEKDHLTAQMHISKSFLVATNHDANSESENSEHASQHTQKMALAGMQDLVDESQDRKRCMAGRWQKAVIKYMMANQDATEDDVAIKSKDIIRWLQRYPITNEQTHYGCVMDPSEGKILWVKKYEVEER